MTHLTVFDLIDDDALKALELRLEQNAEEQNAPPYQSTPLSVLAHDDNGALVGGLTGKTFWNWLYIDMLWVRKEDRGKGLGRELVDKAETLAVQRGCISSYLWTESFEAPEFYPKLGYQKFVVKEDFPLGHQRIGFMKSLRR
ncbi:MAG: GNAT family N-acetyltransferase [Alphaproteobacteria bacterium]|nr:GNAT family N-acetyltransferase [Alphaproteobacteria bacterium]